MPTPHTIANIYDDRTSSNCYVGELSGLAGNIVYGWAMNVENQDARIILEILVDGQPSGLCAANQLQPDANGIGDGLHGFSLCIPEQTLSWGQHISARVANQNILIGETLLIGENKSSSLPVGSSQVWYSGGLILSGWIWDPDNAGKQLSVCAMEHDTVVARAVANAPHPALVGLESTEHGFVLELPLTLANGNPHKISVRDDKGRLLAGSPIQICAHPFPLSKIITKAWTEKKSDATPAAVRSIIDLLRHYECVSPMSIGFSQYAHWFSLNESTARVTDISEIVAPVRILITGDSTDCIEASRLSAEQQLVQCSIELTSGDLRSSILKAISDGAVAVVPLLAGDRLAQNYVKTTLAAFKNTFEGWIFTDCDQDSPTGKRINPWLKPAWDPDFFIGMDIVTPGSLWKTELLKASLDQFPDTALPDWQTVSVVVARYLLAVGKLESGVIRQTGVLYHRSKFACAHPYEVPRSPEAIKQLAELVHEMTPGATLHYNNGTFRVIWPVPALPPRVSLVIPTRDQHLLLKACVEGLITNTLYPEIEILVVDNQSTDPLTLSYLEQIKSRGVRVLKYDQPFNYSAINNFAVQHSTGEIIGLINNDIEVIDGTWLTEMISQLLRKKIGAVGARACYELPARQGR